MSGLYNFKALHLQWLCRPGHWCFGSDAANVSRTWWARAHQVRAARRSARRRCLRAILSSVKTFAEIAQTDAPTLDLLALAIAQALRPVDDAWALAELDRLASEVVRHGLGETPAEQLGALETVLGQHEGFVGDVEEYDHPDNSMLDLVLRRHRGLPILLSVVWIEVGRRVGMPLRGVGLPGHYVAGWFGQGTPILIDPFKGGTLIIEEMCSPIEPTAVQQTALRICSNLVGSYERRGDIGRTLIAAKLRLALPLDDLDRRVMEFEHKRVSARMN